MKDGLRKPLDSSSSTASRTSGWAAFFPLRISLAVTGVSCGTAASQRSDEGRCSACPFYPESSRRAFRGHRLVGGRAFDTMAVEPPEGRHRRQMLCCRRACHSPRRHDFPRPLLGLVQTRRGWHGHHLPRLGQPAAESCGHQGSEGRRLAGYGTTIRSGTPCDARAEARAHRPYHRLRG